MSESVEYRDIPGFPGYRVGDDGSVWSCRKTGHARGFHASWHRVNGSALKRGGHRIVALRRDNRSHCRYTHRLVLEAFVGPCPEGREACHGDGDTENNTLGNLRWDTHAANMADMGRHGTAARGAKNPNAKLTDDAVREMRAMRARGALYRQIADHFGVADSGVARILTGQMWAHVGGDSQNGAPDWREESA